MENIYLLLVSLRYIRKFHASMFAFLQNKMMKANNITSQFCQGICVVMGKLGGDLLHIEGYCAVYNSAVHPNRRIHLFWSESWYYFFPPHKFMFRCESVILLAASLCICYGDFQCHALYDLHPQTVSNKSCILLSGRMPSEWILIWFAICIYSFTSSIIILSI